MQTIRFALIALKKNKFHSILNIVGLTIGLFSGVVLILLVKNDLSFDTSHELNNRIYRIVSNFTIEGEEDRFALTSKALAPLLKEEFPEVQEIVRFRPIPRILVKNLQNNNLHYEENFVFADSSVFRVFTHKFIIGDSKNSLVQANSIVLTEQMALKYFGETNVIGKYIELEDQTMRVTGVIENLPSNSHMKYDGIVSYFTADLNLIKDGIRTSIDLWNVHDYSYILLNKHASIEDLYDKFPSFFMKYMNETGKLINGMFVPFFQPLTQSHFYSNDLQFDRPTGNVYNTYALILVALLVFVLTITNYINLVMANANSRFQSIGIRRAMGESKLNTIVQILLESFLLTSFSAILAYILTYIIIDKDFLLVYFNLTGEINSTILVSLFLFLIFLFSILAGILPAILIAGNPIINNSKVLNYNPVSNNRLRKVIFILQFSVSIIVLICSVLLTQQMDFVQKSDLGFKKDNALVLPMSIRWSASDFSFLKSQLSNYPSITSTTFTKGIPGSDPGKFIMEFAGADQNKKELFHILVSGPDYLKSMQIDLIDGRDFDDLKSNDLKNNVLINESAAKLFGSISPINKQIWYPGSEPKTIIGIVKDINLYSLKKNVEPMVIFEQESPVGSIVVRYKPEEYSSALQAIRKEWENVTDDPLNFEFLNNIVQSQYASDLQLGGLLTYSGILSAVMSLIGLIGILSMTLERKKKQIAIRKTLGSTVSQILQLIFKEILRLILAGIIVAIPLSLLIFKYWLNNFAYQKEISYPTIALISLLSVLLTWIFTISYSYKVATENPAINIRVE